MSEYDRLKKQKDRIELKQWVKDSAKYDPAATTPLLGKWGEFLAAKDQRIKDLEERVRWYNEGDDLLSEDDADEEKSDD